MGEGRRRRKAQECSVRCSVGARRCKVSRPWPVYCSVRPIPRLRNGRGATPAEGDPVGDLACHRAYLVRRARLRLGHADLAEDVVQETLVAALLGLDRFDRRSSVRTWLVSILHNKIVDEIRRRLRHGQMDRRDDDVRASDAVDGQDAAGLYECACDLPAPEAHLQARELFSVVEQRLAGMSPKHANAFVMRDILEHSSEHICAELGITSNNLFVMLHRTRSALRRTLEARGYERPPSVRRPGVAR